MEFVFVTKLILFVLNDLNSLIVIAQDSLIEHDRPQDELTPRNAKPVEQLSLVKTLFVLFLFIRFLLVPIGIVRGVVLSARLGLWLFLVIVLVVLAGKQLGGLVGKDLDEL